MYPFPITEFLDIPTHPNTIIYTRPDKIPRFVNEVLPNIKSSFTLVTMG